MKRSFRLVSMRQWHQHQTAVSAVRQRAETFFRFKSALAVFTGRHQWNREYIRAAVALFLSPSYSCGHFETWFVKITIIMSRPPACTMQTPPRCILTAWDCIWDNLPFLWCMGETWFSGRCMWKWLNPAVAWLPIPMSRLLINMWPMNLISNWPVLDITSMSFELLGHKAAFKEHPKKMSWCLRVKSSLTLSSLTLSSLTFLHKIICLSVHRLHLVCSIHLFPQ